MNAIKIDFNKYKKTIEKRVKEKSKVRTRWQDETTKWIEEFGIIARLRPFVWKKVGKKGKNFNYIEIKVASIRDTAKTYGKSCKEYAGNFINMLKEVK